MTNYQVGDFIIQIKNAVMSRKRSIAVKKTRYIVEVANCIERMGYIKGLKEKDDMLKLDIVFRGKDPLFTSIKLVTKPGLRIYQDAQTLRAYRGPATFVISTPHGVLSLREAIKKNTGGEVVAEII
jgi:small subunit ribosomal protein S8